MAVRVTQKQTTKTKAKGKGDIRDKLHQLLQQVDECWYEISLLLSDIYNQELFRSWGYESFKDYVSAELPFEYRNAMYRVEVGDVIRKLKLKKDDMIKIGGWTKLKELAGILKEADEEEAEVILDKTKDMSVRETRDFVREVRYEMEGKEDQKKVKKSVLRFKFTQDQLDIVENAISLAKERADTDNESLALEYICAEWMEMISEASEPTENEDEEEVEI